MSSSSLSDPIALNTRTDDSTTATTGASQDRLEVPPAAAAAAAIIVEVRPNDVLLGRGTPFNVNEGNVRFRELILIHMNEYQAAEKRLRKDGIARAIIAKVQSRGGRFLQRAESPDTKQLLHLDGKPLWEEADDEVVLLKVKQALRGKRQPKASQSSSEVHQKEEPKEHC